MSLTPDYLTEEDEEMGQHADPRVFTCVGPPGCALQGEDAVRAMQAGCPVCKVSTWNGDDWTEKQGPGHA